MRVIDGRSMQLCLDFGTQVLCCGVLLKDFCITIVLVYRLCISNDDDRDETRTTRLKLRIDKDRIDTGRLATLQQTIYKASASRTAPRTDWEAGAGCGNDT